MTAPAPGTRAADRRGEDDGFEAAMQRLAAVRAAAAAEEALRVEQEEQDQLNYYSDTAVGREYEH